MRFYSFKDETEVDEYPQCLEIWPEYLKKHTQLYNFGLLFIQYLFPLIVLSFCYIRIGIVLRQSKAPGESIKVRDDKMLQTKKKVNSLLALVCFIFVNCNFQHHLDDQNVLLHGPHIYSVVGAHASNNSVPLLR